MNPSHTRKHSPNRTWYNNPTGIWASPLVAYGMRPLVGARSMLIKQLPGRIDHA
jgi:hypothetical protein